MGQPNLPAAVLLGGFLALRNSPVISWTLHYHLSVFTFAPLPAPELFTRNLQANTTAPPNIIVNDVEGSGVAAVLTVQTPGSPTLDAVSSIMVAKSAALSVVIADETV